MKSSFIFLIGLFLSSYTFSENEEKTKNLLYAQKINPKNFELGKSISPDTKEKWVENMISADMKNYMACSGLDYFEASIKEKKLDKCMSFERSHKNRKKEL